MILRLLTHFPFLNTNVLKNDIDDNINTGRQEKEVENYENSTLVYILVVHATLDVLFE